MSIYEVKRICEQKEVNRMDTQNKSTVEVNGVTVFSAYWVMEQMTVLMDRNRRALSRARWSIAIAVLSVLLSLVAIVTR